MAAPEAVQFLIDDHGDKGSGYREDFAQDKPYRSLLQRNGKTLEELLKLFEWAEDDATWVAEYDKKKGQQMEKLVRFRRRVCFDIGGWRELREDFTRGDVDCIRDMRTPFVTSRTPLRAMKDEFNQ